jgi:hypothetical protein
MMQYLFFWHIQRSYGMHRGHLPLRVALFRFWFGGEAGCGWADPFYRGIFVLGATMAEGRCRRYG